MNKLKEPKSLFDYLGYPAGKEVGKQVFIFAKKINSPTSTRTVANTKYKGNVTLYEETFLKYYFTVVNPDSSKITLSGEHRPTPLT